MKFSEQWLREWVDPGVTTDALAARLTMAGLEVEATEPAGAALPNVVSAEVRSVRRHPDAERLSVCTVFDGTSEWQVVCGAPNVRPGLKVALAREGAELPGLIIRRTMLRGVESCGMLCSADELGLEAARAEGLLELPADLAPGLPVASLYGGDDRVFSLKLTPNRGDCMSMAGLAREVAALYRVPVRTPDCSPVPARIDDTFDVTLAAPDACPRYAGRVIRNVDVTARSPLWLQERLRRAGVRSIDAVVDVTNYVMLELGQPLHAFDFARLSGRIVVRRAQAGETLELLDGNTLALQPDALLIADANGPVALAGIMGGEQSAVGAATRDIFLESAFFAPLPMAGKARQVGMQTDASQRFERGVDFRLQAVAIERATRLLLGITGGTPGPVVVACAEEHLPRLEPVQLRAARLDRLLGVTVPAPEVEDILRRLGLGVTREADGWRVTPTSYRFDLRIEADLVEEVGRVYGYEHIPARVQPHAMPIRARPETRLELHDMRRRLIALGYQEAITYSFVEPRLQALLDPDVEPVAVANPISADMAVMRTTLWTGLLKTVQHNQHRQQRRVRVFETGLRFLPTAEGLQQRLAIAAVASGERLPENWTSDRGALDFYDLRGDVEALLDGGQGMARLTVAPAVHPALHPGQSAVLRVDGQDAGWLGALHPELEAALDLQGPVYLFELDVEMISRKNLPSFKALSKFPEVRRDIAVLVDRTMPAETVLETARSAAGALLVDLKLFDVYRGQGIDENQKSLALGVVLQDRERTLTDAEVGAVMDGIVAALATHCGAIPRV